MAASFPSYKNHSERARQTDNVVPGTPPYPGCSLMQKARSAKHKNLIYRVSTQDLTELKGTIVIAKLGAVQARSRHQVKYV